MSNKNKVLFLIDSSKDMELLPILIEEHGRSNIIGLITPGINPNDREMYERCAMNNGIDYYSIPISIPVASIISQLRHAGIIVSDSLITDYLPSEIKKIIKHSVDSYINEV